MKKTMKTSRLMFGIAAAGCALGAAQPACATVSDADFNALKALVDQMNGKMQSLEQTNQLNQQIIGQLQQKLIETQQTAVAAQQNSIAAQQSAVAASQAQPETRPPLDEATVNHNFQILGDAEFQYDKVNGQNGSFMLADFAPIFLYRGGDKILFEAGFDFILQNNAPGGEGYTTTVNLSFAQLDYVFNDYITLCAGNLLLPLGTYSERSAGWLNKFPDNPLAVDLIPGTGVGAELRGALPVGDSGKILNYAVYGVNGPGSSDGTGNAGSLDIAGGNVGFTSDGRTANLHKNLVGGARLGFFLPLTARYDLEFGVSAQSGEWDDAGQHLYTAGVLDAALHLGPNFEAKGEYIVDSFGSDDLGEVRQSGWFLQAGYKLAGLNLETPFINNTELVARYDTLRDGMGTTTDRYTVGGIYYITTALLFEGDYEIIHSSDPTQPGSQLLLQISYGF
jgi:hypothetical protein